MQKQTQYKLGEKDCVCVRYGSVETMSTYPSATGLASGVYIVEDG